MCRNIIGALIINKMRQGSVTPWLLGNLDPAFPSMLYINTDSRLPGGFSLLGRIKDMENGGILSNGSRNTEENAHR